MRRYRERKIRNPKKDSGQVKTPASASIHRGGTCLQVPRDQSRDSERPHGNQRRAVSRMTDDESNLPFIPPLLVEGEERLASSVNFSFSAFPIFSLFSNLNARATF